MIFTLSQDQIQQIKSGIFPDLSNDTNIVDLKSCVLNTAGSDTIFKLNLLIKDALISNDPSYGKIFNNKVSQKMMKMIIFEIFNNQIRTEALKCKTSLELETLIRNYGLLNYNLSPSFDFEGSKSRIEEHDQENGYILLSYKKDFILPEAEVQNFSLGVALFYDFEIYSKEQNIKPEFIEKQILFGGIKVWDLISEKESSSIVSDLRLVKSLFKNQNEDSQFLFTEDKASTGLSLLENISSNIIDNNNITKLLSEKQKKINNDVYFSNAYYSRNIDGKLSFIFNVDYKNLIANNSSYKKFINNSSLSDEFLDNISMSSITIKRRRILKSTNKDKPKIYNRNDGYHKNDDNSIKQIIVSKESKETGLVEFLQNDSYTIKENSLFLSEKRSNIRSFEITDAEVFGLNSGLYQYGLEIILEDSFFDKLLQRIGESRQDIKNLKAYVKETEKTLRITKEYDSVKLSKPKFNLATIPVLTSQTGVYDAATNSFTKEFIKNYNKDVSITDDDGSIKTYNFSSLNNSAISRFVLLLELFGIKAGINNDKAFIINTFLSMLHPETASSETILYFIKAYENFINKMEKIFSSINKNKQIIIEYWFINDYVNADEDIKIGYDFIENEDKNGLGTISVAQLKNIVDKEILKYSTNLDIDNINMINKFEFISPSKIYTDNRILNLDDAINQPDDISQYEFAEVEIDIKRLNLLNKSGNNITITTTPNSLPTRQQFLNLRMNNIMHDLSISIPNMLKTKVTTINNSIAADNSVNYNSKVDPAYLFLSLSKNIDMINHKLIEKKLDNYFISDKKAKKKYKEKYDNLVPIQIKLLVENQAKLLKKEDSYLSSLDFNSIFLFFYNSIHSIEYLNYSTDAADYHMLKDEYWLKLDEKLVDTIEEKDLTVLCRLKVYQDQLIGIKDWQQIKLPIYNQYFLLSGKPTSFSKRNPRPRNFNQFSSSMRSIINDLDTNRLVRGIKPPPPARPPATPKAPERLPDNSIRLVGSLSPERAVLDTMLSVNNKAPPTKQQPAKPAVQSPLIEALGTMNINVGLGRNTPTVPMNSSTNSTPSTTPAATQAIKVPTAAVTATSMSNNNAGPAAQGRGLPPFIGKVTGKLGR
jgi:hypothetical protein